jgi:predicted Zn-dependent protease
MSAQALDGSALASSGIDGTGTRERVIMVRMRRCIPVVLVTLLFATSGAIQSPAGSQERAPGEPMVLIRDAETETLLHGFAKPLFQAAGLDPGLVRILLVRDRAINAFVTTGNRMFVNSGLIRSAGSAGEVVGAMAHETGHVAHGDISRLPEMAAQTMWQSLGSLLIGVGAGVASRNSGVAVGAGMGGLSMAQRGFMSFSRNQEEKADQSGLRYLERLGWPADGLLTMFSRLEEQEALSINRRDPYLITHPLTHERLEFVRRHVEDMRDRAPRLPAAMELSFTMVKAKLAGFLDPPTQVMRAYKSGDLSIQARYAKSIAEHRQGHDSAALALLEGSIAEQPANPWLKELQGQILLEMGQPRAAIPAYRAAIRLAPDQPLLRQSLGHALTETGDKAMFREAVTELDIARRQDREDDTTWHMLGIAWGRLGDIGQANLALAEGALLANDIPIARRFARQAAEALPPGPARLRALDIGNASMKENRP